jgi:predicted Zn-dependent peptidase
MMKKLFLLMIFSSFYQLHALDSVAQAPTKQLSAEISPIDNTSGDSDFAEPSLVETSFVDPYKNIIQMKLDNGMQVYMLSDDKAVNTRIELKVGVGMDVENDESYGISHLVEHMIFRDQRIPHRDYVDYMKEQGASYVNGYTKRYETGYKATIESSKSYWITEVFAKMIFDKSITLKDLNIERGAIQTEIGAYEWIEKPLWHLNSLIEVLSPPKEDIYADDFSLAKLKNLPPPYQEKLNNQDFTMQNVMKHYETYYYPANMTLKIVGGFDPIEMQRLIRKHYGSIARTGIERSVKPSELPRLNGKPYNLSKEGKPKNSGYIGAKYILDDYKKHLIIDTYVDNLAVRLQQKLKNDLGHTYTVSSTGFSSRKARVASVHFDGLDNEFESNIVAVKEAIKNDIGHISNQTIEEALEQSKKNYASIGHDSRTLMKLVNKTEYLHDQHNTTESPFAIINSVSHSDFRNTIKETFIDKNMYSTIYRNYYYFRYDLIVLSITSVLVLFLLYFQLHHIDRIQQKISCGYRHVVMHRRISNRFLGTLYIIIIFAFTFLIWTWLKYLFFTHVIGNSLYISTIDVPYRYLWMIIDALVSIFIVLFSCRYLFNYHARLAATEDRICIVGHRMKSISLGDIETIETTNWSIKNAIRSFGISLLFWKPLVKIKLRNGKVLYIRNKNAQHLKEDLNKWYRTYRAVI